MSVVRRITNLFSRSQVDREIDAELRSHLEMRVEDNLAAGMPPEEARREALLRFGNPVVIREHVTEADTHLWLEAIWRDLCFAARRLRRSPGFTFAATMMLAIGIGGVALVFAAIEAVLLRPLPYPHPEQLIALHEGLEHLVDEVNLSAPDILTFKQDSRAFSGVGGFLSSAYEATGAGAPFRAQAERVSASVFPVLGVAPFLGRTFTPQEDESSAPVLVISYALWQERYQSNAGVLGKTIELDRRPYTIIGVMPPEFEFPVDVGRLSHHDLWVPMSFTPVEKTAEGDNYDYGAVARLRPGVSPAQAQQDIDRVIAIIRAKYQGIQVFARMRSLKDETVRNTRPLLRVLLAAVALILVIACANLANLLLVRAAGRRREFGVRLALGAGRRAMLRQLLTESLLLSALGGTLGLLLAAALLRIGGPFLLDSLPRTVGLFGLQELDTFGSGLGQLNPALNEMGIGWPVALLAVLLMGATGVLCGLAPALASTKASVLDSLRDGGQGAGNGRSLHRLRGMLVAGEVALALMLLVASGLLLRSFAKMLASDPGFQLEHVMTASLALPRHDYPTQQSVDTFLQKLQQWLQASPGVNAVGFSSNIPVIGRNSSRAIAPEGYVRKPGEKLLLASNYSVQGDYFSALRIPLLAGRFFRDADDQPGAPLAVIVSQSFAQKYFPGTNAIGMHVKIGIDYKSNLPPMTVVGVVGDIKANHLDEDQMAQMYEPISQAAADLGPLAPMIGVVGDMRAVVRTAGDPVVLEGDFLKIIHRLDPLLAITEVHTMEDVVAATEAPRRFNTALLTGFAGIALVLSLLGIYGVLAYTVTERTREIAIRMALGATRREVLAGILRYAAALAAIGITAGLIASAGLMRFLASLLYGVKPLDATAILAAVCILLACAILAAWIPARRAASVDPMQALRTE